MSWVVYRVRPANRWRRKLRGFVKWVGGFITTVTAGYVVWLLPQL